MPARETRSNIEGKYTVDLSDGFVRTILGRLCRADTQFPADYINSAYYDTPNLALLDQKVSSEFLKSKLRLRWYGRPEGKGLNVPAYLEFKKKEGAQRSKTRKKFEVRSDWLLPGRESFRDLARYSDFAAELTRTLPTAIFPMIVIRYFRHRFTDPATGARISLDSGISYTRVNGIFFPETGPRMLRHGVLEIKSETGEIPRTIMAIKSRVNTRDSFSKYAECWGLYSSTSYKRQLTSSRYD